MSKVIQLIQFTDVPGSEYGYMPDTAKLYKVYDFDAELCYETVNDDGDDIEEYVDAINIYVSNNSRRKVIKDASLQYNLINIELEPDCKLFGGR